MLLFINYNFHLLVICTNGMKQLGFSEIQAELTNLPILPNLPNFLPNFVKLKKYLKCIKIKIFKIYFILD